MRWTPSLLAGALAGLAAPATGQPDFAPAVAADYRGHLEALFLDFHRNPELSYRETRDRGDHRPRAPRRRRRGDRAGRRHRRGRRCSGTATDRSVLVRADMDGLPLAGELAACPMPRTVRQAGIDNVEAPVMHACGHDVHITALIGTARQLMRLSERWRGTAGADRPDGRGDGSAGARAMIEDGLYTRFPRPAYALAFHVAAELPAGRIVVQPGLRRLLVGQRRRSSSTVSAPTAPIRTRAGTRS